MSIIKPFKAWIPNKEDVASVATRSSGYANNEEIIKILQENPLTYLHAVKPYLHFGTTEKVPSLHFAYGANYIKQLKEFGVIKHQTSDAIYLYRQHNKDTNQIFSGVIGLCSQDAYLRGKIKLHEKTLTEKENMLIEHIKYTKMSGEPVLMMQKFNGPLNDFLNKCYKTVPYLNFDYEEINHQLWIVDAANGMDQLLTLLNCNEEIYIADGHHRSAALTRYISEESANAEGFMSLTMFMEDLAIMPFHRLVRCKKDNLLALLQNAGFEVAPSAAAIIPETKRTFGLYYQKQWYLLKLTNQIENDLILDVDVIEQQILKNVCDIKNSQSDNNVDFFEGNKPLEQAISLINSGEYDLMITLHPCEISDVCKIADAGLTMPPKSTYILPKLLTGLTIHQLKD